jgi:hypothetical protein
MPPTFSLSLPSTEATAAAQLKPGGIEKEKKRWTRRNTFL